MNGLPCAFPVTTAPTSGGYLALLKRLLMSEIIARNNGAAWTESCHRQQTQDDERTILLPNCSDLLAIILSSAEQVFPGYRALCSLPGDD